MKLKNIKNFRDLLLTGDKVFYQLWTKHRTTAVMEMDWDNLVILDACRYDMFKEVNFLTGKLGYIYSKGSSTGHFLTENFKGKFFGDTVYLTSNPLVDYYVKYCFYKTIPVWKKGFHEPLQTVLPQTVVDYALKAQKDFPHKRLIVHFMQPHFPFLGKSRQKIGSQEGVLSRGLFYGGKTKHTQTVWLLFRKGKLDKDTVWDAYRENLLIVLDYVKKLVKDLKGKTVISSDHANLFGEWLFPFPLKEYGHPGGIYKKSAIKVPWFIPEYQQRKKIKEAPSPFTSQPEQSEETLIKERLKSLGYYL